MVVRFNVDALTVSEKYRVTLTSVPAVIRSKPVSRGGEVSGIKSVARVAVNERMFCTLLPEVSLKAFCVNEI